jgi:hypothetical protein
MKTVHLKLDDLVRAPISAAVGTWVTMTTRLYGPMAPRRTVLSVAGDATHGWEREQGRDVFEQKVLVSSELARELQKIRQ